MRKLLAIILFLFALLPAEAAHIIGGEMFYTYIGSGTSPNSIQWRITLRLFRDALNCTAANNCADLPTSVPIAIFNNDNNLIVGSIRDIARTNYIPSLPIVAAPPCLNPVPIFQYEQGDFSFTVELPINTNGYTVNYQTCCRVANIITVGGGQSSPGSGYPCIIPGSATMPARNFDNSPIFQTGISIICYNKPFTLDFSASDYDGDSLSYSFIEALNGGAATNSSFANPSAPPYNSINYVNPYNASNQFGTNMVINPHTGIITGTAPGAGKYIVSVAVRSYKNGQFISLHRKDFIVTVAPCDIVDATLKPVYTSCDGFTFNFTNESPSSPLNISFSWDFGDGGTSNLEFPSHTYAVAGDYNVKLVINRGSQCADSATTIVKVWPGFNAGINAPDSVCKNTPIQFMDGTTLSYGAISYWKWDFGVTSTLSDTSRIKNPSYTYNGSGTYDVTLIVKSTKGCEDTIIKPITILDRAVLNLTNDTLICKIDTLQLNAFVSSAAVGNFTWSPNYMISSTTIPNPLVSPDVTTTYYVNYSDNFGCTGRDSVKVNVVDDVTLLPASDTTICLTDSVRLNIQSNGTGFVWTPSATLNNASIQNPYATPTQQYTTYQVLASIGKCKKTSSVTIKTVPYPNAKIGADTSICFGKSVQLNASGGSVYLWTPKTFLTNANIANPISVNPQYSINYIVKVTDTLGCPKPDYDTMRINVIRVQVWGLPNDTSVVLNQPLQLNVHGGTQYLWAPSTWLNNPNIHNPLSLPHNNISYAVTVTDNNGCFAKDTINVKVFFVAPDLYVPSAFTPGQDGLNDLFRPIPLGIKQLDYFRVYNRWGEMVYETHSFGEGWNGKFKGKAQETGTYVWQAQAVDYTGKKIFRKGSVILIR